MTVLTGTSLRRVLVGCMALCALSLSACAGAESHTGRETLSAALDGRDSTSTNAGITPLGDADTEMKTLRPEAPAQLAVTECRVGSHEGFDRVVFELTGEGEPGWFVDYSPNPSQQGSGHSVEYQGATALNVNLDGISYPFDLGIEDPAIGTVEGAGNITEVINLGTFEGRAQFLIGLKEQRPYSVEILQDPPRVVVDIVSR